jgi:hypothetical protein
MNKENLKLMVEHIRTIPQEMFDMSDYRNGQAKTPECDSVGCVLGHCTVLDPSPLPRKGFGSSIDFHAWSDGFTGLIGNEWGWCFSGGWIGTDNTPEGAALRIEWLLKNGLPKDWCEQLLGYSPLCYK